MYDNNRRNWFKKVGLGVVGLSLGQLETFANSNPIPDFSTRNLNDTKILLRSNENPYGPSPLARIAMSESIDKSNRYDWSIASELISEIANKTMFLIKTFF